MQIDTARLLEQGASRLVPAAFKASAIYSFYFATTCAVVFLLLAFPANPRMISSAASEGNLHPRNNTALLTKAQNDQHSCIRRAQGPSGPGPNVPEPNFSSGPGPGPWLKFAISANAT